MLGARVLINGCKKKKLYVLEVYRLCTPQASVIRWRNNVERNAFGNAHKEPSAIGKAPTHFHANFTL